MALILHISGATLLESILMRHLTHFQCVAGIESEECLCTKIQDSNSHCIEGTTARRTSVNAIRASSLVNNMAGSKVCRGTMICLVYRVLGTTFPLIQILTSADLRIITLNQVSVEILMEVVIVVATRNL